MENEELVFCPNCKSKNIITGQKGFSLGKAAAGGILLGPLGLLAGTHRSTDVCFTCLDCGYRFTLKKVFRQKEKEREDEIISALPPAEFHFYRDKSLDGLTPEERELAEREKERKVKRKTCILKLLRVIVIICSIAAIVYSFYKSTRN